MNLTEQERDALIADCKASIARIEKTLTYWQKSTYTLPYLESELARQKIALASLTTKPRKVFTCSNCQAEGLDEPLESRCHCMGEDARWIESVVYNAPPVPVMKAVKLSAGAWVPFYGQMMERQEVVAALREAGIQIEGEE